MWICGIYQVQYQMELWMFYCNILHIYGACLSELGFFGNYHIIIWISFQRLFQLVSSYVWIFLNNFVWSWYYAMPWNFFGTICGFIVNNSVAQGQLSCIMLMTLNTYCNNQRNRNIWNLIIWHYETLFLLLPVIESLSSPHLCNVSMLASYDLSFFLLSLSSSVF